MKTTTIFTAIILSALFISCKNDKKEEQKGETTEPKVEVLENFNVIIEASASKDDNFAMYFSEDGTGNFSDKNAVWRDVKGGGENQKILFDLTEEKIPTNIRLDFGLNKEQDSVVIKSVKVSYYANSFEFKGSDFFTYFNKDEQFKYNINPTNGTLTLYKKDGEYKTPFFYPTLLTNDKVKEITTQKK